MDKTSFLKSITDKEEKMFFSSVYDKLESSESRGTPVFCDFCSEAELAVLEPVIKYFGGSTVSKIKNSERRIPACNSEYVLPTSDIILISGIDRETVSHRDVLGSLMNLGIKRCKIGDIIVGKEVFAEVKNEITPYVLQNLSKVRHRNVKVAVYDEEVERIYEFSEMFLTVSSLRADRIFAGIVGMAGESAKEAVQMGKLQVNSKVMDNPSKNLKEGDVLSIRGSGKYLFHSINGETKKGRIKIVIKKYI